MDMWAQLVVVAREVPRREDLGHLERVLHPFERVRERVGELRVTHSEGVAAVAYRILESARLVAGRKLHLPVRMVLEGAGEYRLVVDDAVDATDDQVLDGLLPILGGDEVHALDLAEPLRVVGAELGGDG